MPMFNKYFKQNLKQLSNEITLVMTNQGKQELIIKKQIGRQQELFENQKYLLGMIKRLANCFQL